MLETSTSARQNRFVIVKHNMDAFDMDSRTFTGELIL